jgi:hypothetical protein
MMGDYQQTKEFEAILDTLKQRQREAEYDHSSPVPVFRGPLSSAGREYPIQQQVLDQILIQSHGIPPMVLEATADYDSKTVRYDHAAAEAASVVHLPGCTCAPCVVVLRDKQIAELNDRLVTERKHSADLYDLASRSLYAESNTRKNLDKVAARSREVAAVPALRVGDTERNLYIEHLGNMYSDGHLTQEEFSERSDKANEAKTMDDLRPLVADLPSMVTTIVPGAKTVPAVRRTPLMERVVTPAMGIWALGSVALLLLLLVLGVL